MRAASRELAVAIAILLSANASGNSTQALRNSYGGHRRQGARLQAECGVTGDCVTLDTCNDDYAGNCDAPTQYVCEHQLPGLNVCESPPLETMLPCWMSSLDDGLPLSEISIPGTHDTMAKGSSSCLQSGSGNYIHTQINDLGPSTRTPEESLQESLDAYPNHWIAGSTIPTLGEARGKVVLANDMAREEQNEYDLATLGEVSGKKDLVRNFFLESDSAPAAWGAFRLNYFSGTGASVYPLTVAAGVRAVFQGTNEVLFEFSDGCLGVTMFDFIGEDAIAHVVAQQGITAPAWNPPES